MTALTLTGISVRYGRQTAVDHIDLTITGPGCHCLVGPNGAGKTSLLAAIAGTQPVAAGRITLDDLPITHAPPGRRARLGVARTFQTPRCWPDLDALRNVILGAGHQRCRRYSELVTAALHVLDQVGLSAHARRRAAELSHGQRRLLDIAIALAGRPRVLLLDEPTAGLNDEDLHRLTALVRDLAAATTVVLVEHHLDVVADLATAITVLADGKVLATGDYPTVAADPHVTARYPLLAGIA